MTSIFYDLETSDREPIGQILNYSFIATDEDFNVIDECSGDVQISRLQIPSPDAILTNRIRVLDHQARATDSEPEAMLRIGKFIASTIDASKTDVAFVGFNSNRFDLPYLRTSFIRNGLNPYFSKKLKAKDLLQAVRKLAVTNPKFPKPVQKSEEGDKFSFRLEHITQALGLLKGVQSHASRADVLLTIELAKCLKSDWGIDVRRYVAYEADASQNCISVLDVEYSPSSESASVKRCFGLLNQSYRAALWVDLDKYTEEADRSCISWFNKATGQLFVEGECSNQDFLSKLDSARKRFAKITTDNFFPVSTCDIEQDIYRIDFQRQDLLAAAIWQDHCHTPFPSPDKDARILFMRYKMRVFDFSAELEKLLKAYALHRYGGQLQLVKILPDEPKDGTYHPTLQVIVDRANQITADASDVEDKNLMQQLLKFIFSSEIYSVAGRELLTEQSQGNLSANS